MPTPFSVVGGLDFDPGEQAERDWLERPRWSFRRQRFVRDLLPLLP